MTENSFNKDNVNLNQGGKNEYVIVNKMENENRDEIENEENPMSMKNVNNRFLGNKSDIDSSNSSNNKNNKSVSDNSDSSNNKNNKSNSNSDSDSDRDSESDSENKRKNLAKENAKIKKDNVNSMKLRNAYETLKIECEDLQNQIEDLRKLLDKKNEKIGKLKNLSEGNVKHFTNELTNLKKELEAYKIANRTLQIDNEHLTQKVDLLEETISKKNETIRKQKDLHKKAIQKYEEMIDEKAENLEDYTIRNVTNLRKIKELKLKNDDLSKKNNKLTKSLYKKTDDFNELRESIYGNNFKSMAIINNEISSNDSEESFENKEIEKNKILKHNQNKKNKKNLRYNDNDLEENKITNTKVNVKKEFKKPEIKNLSFYSENKYNRK